MAAKHGIDRVGEHRWSRSLGCIGQVVGCGAAEPVEHEAQGHGTDLERREIELGDEGDRSPRDTHLVRIDGSGQIVAQDHVEEVHAGALEGKLGPPAIASRPFHVTQDHRRGRPEQQNALPVEDLAEYRVRGAGAVWLFRHRLKRADVDHLIGHGHLAASGDRHPDDHCAERVRCLERRFCLVAVGERDRRSGDLGPGDITPSGSFDGRLHLHRRAFVDVLAGLEDDRQGRCLGRGDGDVSGHGGVRRGGRRPQHHGGGADHAHWQDVADF